MKHILIVEDDTLLNKTLAYNLKSDGFDITTVWNARTAAEKLTAGEYDLVLLDINLPDGNGYDLCRLVKPEHPDTLVIFLTANDQEKDQIQGYEAGICCFFIFLNFDELRKLSKVASAFIFHATINT